MAKEKTDFHDDMKTLFSSPMGQRVLLGMMRANHVFDTTYFSTDPSDMLIAEGQRRVVLNIVKVCRGEINPGDFIDDSYNAEADYKTHMPQPAGIHDPTADDDDDK